MKKYFIALCLFVIFVALARIVTTDMPTYAPQTEAHKHDISNMLQIAGFATAAIALTFLVKKRKKANN